MAADEAHGRNIRGVPGGGNDRPIGGVRHVVSHCGHGYLDRLLGDARPGNGDRAATAMAQLGRAGAFVGLAAGTDSWASASRPL